MSAATLRKIPARSIVRAIADAAERWCDADFPPRVRVTAAIEARLGYTTPTVDYALDRLFESLSATAIETTIESELGSLAVLDGFVTMPGRPRAFARGVDHVVIVASDTTIGVALAPLVFALAAKCGVVVKDRSDALVAAFAQTLGEERPEISAALDVREWEGAAGDAAIANADVVVAFGSGEALRALRLQTHADATFVPYGHRASIGWLSAADIAQSDARDIAGAIARDALLYDGSGCLSLHVLFAECGTELDAFIPILRDACAAQAIEFPPGTRDRAQQATTRAYLETIAFRSANGAHARVMRGPDDDWALVVDADPRDVPPLGGGVLTVLAVDRPEDAVGFVRRHALPLEALGVARVDSPMCDLATAVGAVRVVPFGRMQAPPLEGRHGGRLRCTDFVRWIDAE